MLNHNQTFEQTGLDQQNRAFPFDVCIKTRVLIEQILQNRRKF